MSASWNPWHGCRKLSPGCLHCYVYRIDSEHDRDGSEIVLNKSHSAPLARDRHGNYKIPSGETVYTCFTSDFFLEEADEWRVSAWDVIRQRSDLDFVIVTKRIDRFAASLPDDWGDGYENVSIGCTCENNDRAAYRLPLFLAAPIRRRFIICEPLLEEIELSRFLDAGKIASLIAGGESGPDARACDFAWVLSLREQCRRAGIAFTFKQTGANFRRDGRLYRIPRQYQAQQAHRAGIDLPADTDK